jgi:hypothetical protein
MRRGYPVLRTLKSAPGTFCNNEVRSKTSEVKFSSFSFDPNVTPETQNAANLNMTRPGLEVRDRIGGMGVSFNNYRLPAGFTWNEHFPFALGAA